MGEKKLSTAPLLLVEQHWKCYSSLFALHCKYVRHVLYTHANAASNAHNLGLNGSDISCSSCVLTMPLLSRPIQQLLFWELELQHLTVALWAHTLWQHETKGMSIRISRPGPRATAIGVIHTHRNHDTATHTKVVQMDYTSRTSSLEEFTELSGLN
eukprot:3087748-Amphidinium_carterae.1